MSLEDRIKQAGEEFGYSELRSQQLHVIKAYCEGKDVFFCAPTRAGKSATFELACKVLGDNSKILVVSPLVSLMTMQASKLNEKGIKAAYIISQDDPDSYIDSASCSVSVTNLMDSDIDVWIASPETCLGSLRELIATKAKNIRAIFIDEAHCILK